ncbi:MAG: hypothetical protein HDQ89_10605 [Desulfovibrio sp.]|nr:hypothetical protein [Desulfovibrio sp.]
MRRMLSAFILSPEPPLSHSGAMMTAQRMTFFSVLFFLFLGCIFFITRDACLTPTKMTGYDASVFATFGAAWHDGLLPYKAFLTTRALSFFS